MASPSRFPPPPPLFGPKLAAQPSNQPQQPKPKENIFRRAFNYAWNTPWNIAHPGQALANSAADAGSERILTFLAQQHPTLSNHLRQILYKAILNACPAPLLTLEELLRKSLGDNPSPLTHDEIDELIKLLEDLSDDRVLGELSQNLVDEQGKAIDLYDDGKTLFPELLKLLKGMPPVKVEGKESKSSDMPDAAEVPESKSDEKGNLSLEPSHHALPKDHGGTDRKDAADGKENKHGTIAPLEKTRPVLSKDILSRMQQLHEVVALLVRNNQGLLRNSLGFFAQFLEKVINDPESGLLKRFETSLTDEETGLFKTLEKSLTDKDKGLLKKIEDSLTNEEKGLFIKLLEWAKKKVQEDGGVLAALNDELNSQPHKLLLSTRKALDDLSSALKGSAPIPKTIALAKRALALLSEIVAQKDTVFVRMPLKEEHLDEITLLKSLLERLIEGDAQPTYLSQQLQASINILNGYFNREEGLVPRTARVFVETIINKISEGPRRILDYFKKPKKEEKKEEVKEEKKEDADEKGVLDTTTEPDAAELVTTDQNPAEVSAELPLREYLDSALGFATQFLSSATDMIKKPALKQFGACLLVILEGIKRRTDNTPHFEQTHAILNKLIENISEALKKEDLQAFVAAIKDSLKEPKYLQVYLNGIKIPKLSLDPNPSPSSSIASFLSNIQELERAQKNNPKKEMKKIDYDLLIDEEEKIFTKKTSAFGSMKLSCYISGISPSEDFYSKIVQGSESTLKEHFFKAVDALDIHAFKKSVVKFLYRVISPIAELIVKQTTSRFIKDIKQGIHKGFSGLEVSPFRRFSSYLSILGESYIRAANNPTGTLEESIVSALEDPQYNKGFTSAKLYQTVSRKFIDQFTPRFEWTRNLGAWFKKVAIPPSSKLHFLNPVIRAFATIVSFIICTILYLPEKGINKLMLFFLKKFAVRTAVFDDILHKNIEALKSNNSYIYALNKVIYEQLETVWEILKNSVEQNGGLDLGSVGGEQSKMQREELTILVKHLMEVLQKSKYHTPLELRKAIEDKSFLKTARESAEALFINEAVDAASKLIGAVYKSLIPQDQLKKLFYNFISMVNRSYSTGKVVTQEEYQSLEKGIDTMAAKILNLAIRLSLEKRFDFTLKDQRRQATQFVKDLQKETKQFAESATKSMKKLENALTDFTKPPSERKFPQMLEDLIASSIDFQRKRVSPQFDVNGNPNFDTETQKNLDKISSELASLFKKFVAKISEMEKLQQEIVLQQRNKEEFLQIQDILGNIQEIMKQTSFNSDDIRFCENQLASLDQNLESLAGVDRLKELTRDLMADASKLKEHINDLKQAIALERSLLPLMVSTTKSKLYKLVQEKKKSMNADSPVFLSLKDEVLKMVHSVTNLTAKDILSKRIQSILSAKTSRELQQHAEAYDEETSELLEESQKKIQTSIFSLKASSSKIVKSIEGSEEMNPDNVHAKVERIKTLIAQTKMKVKTIDSWADHVEPITIFNPQWMDMGWIIDITKNLAYEEIEKIVSEFLKFTHKHYNFLGFIRHGVLIPYATDAF